MKVVLKDYRSSAPKKPRVSPTTERHNQIPANRLIGNPDLSVLKTENQNATHVTPFIASLALGLVNETLRVVGSPLPQPDKNELQRNKAKRLKRVKELLDRARKEKRDVVWKKADRVRWGYLKKIQIEGETYSVRLVSICTYFKPIMILISCRTPRWVMSSSFPMTTTHFGRTRGSTANSSMSPVRRPLPTSFGNSPSGFRF